jgi:hypothetical protein
MQILKKKNKFKNYNYALIISDTIKETNTTP